MLGRCQLCLEEKHLRLSHIISKRLYKEISRDEKRRMVTIDPATGEQTGLLQDGPKQHLLCEDCEQFINREYEQPFFTYWLDEDRLIPLEHQELLKLTDIDYMRFKLFHLSILFRAGASTLPQYEEVQLGPHFEKIRRMLLDMDPGPANQYPIVCYGLTLDGISTTREFIGAVHRMELEGARCYYATFGGCQWFYYVTSHEVKNIMRICLQGNGMLPICMRTPLIPPSHQAS